MELLTKIDIQPVQVLRASSRVFTIGSCFAEEMADKMREHGMQVESNPFGVLYNPLSIAACLERLLDGRAFAENELTEYGGLYHSMLHHGSFSKIAKEETLDAINQSLIEGRDALLRADVVILTLGTAWVYEKDGRIVGNCHKLPVASFTRRRLTVSEIEDALKPLLLSDALREKQVIVTVSPIRHIKDGLHENQLSKATLLMAVEQLPVMYFPAYEIVLDELRDYRFYAEDMVHPSVTAVNYVWERLVAACFSKEEQAKLRERHAAWKALQHKPLHGETEEYKAFHQKALERWRRASAGE